MTTGLLHLHNLLRWVILITLFLSIYKFLWKPFIMNTEEDIDIIKRLQAEK